MTAPLIHQHVLFTGRVQGVGFRYCTKEVAKGYEVTGWVRNLPDGTVEMRAVAVEEELNAFLTALLESEVGHHITQHTITTHPLPSPAYTDFRITR